MNKAFMKLSTLALLVGGSIFFSACSSSTQSEESNDENMEEVADEEEGEEEEEEAPASPRMAVEDESAGTTVAIDWGSPAVKERVIWGELVPWGEVWRAGANQTTNVTFGSDVTIGDTQVAAGKYGMLLIPQQEGDWTVILTTQWDRDEHGIWGSMGYEEASDVVRVDVAPTWAKESSERVEYGVAEGTITFAWEKARLSIPFSVVE